MKINHRHPLLAVVAALIIIAIAVVACSPATTSQEAPAAQVQEEPTAVQEEPTAEVIEEEPTVEVIEEPTAEVMEEPTAESEEMEHSHLMNANQVAFHNAMRKLWEDHIAWTRLYIVSAAADLPDADLVAQRLLQNQTDIGDAVKGFYGDEAGAALTELLNEHILLAAEAIGHAKAGDTAAFDDALARWYTNADDIATFLSAANPDAWPLDEMKVMMKSHLDLTLEEAGARLGGDFAADIAAYDKVHEDILHMADMLSAGIMQQFPDKFAESGESGHGHGLSESQLALNDAMRKLWEDHIVWTRLYIVSAAADLPDADLVAQRLLQNQTDIGDAVKGFYGDEAGAALTELLNEHILLAAEAIGHAKAGDTTAFDDALARWYTNADDIATFLSTANPDAWPLDEMKAMMKSHLDLTLEEAGARLGGDFAADIAAYDKVHEDILHMADMLSMGLMQQFPDMFSN